MRVNLSSHPDPDVLACMLQRSWGPDHRLSEIDIEKGSIRLALLP